jgi:hypothetical protein
MNKPIDSQNQVKPLPDEIVVTVKSPQNRQQKIENPYVHARPAFYPSNSNNATWAFQSREQEGITLRDHYAGLAMQAYIKEGRTQHDIALVAFDMADRMLEARLPK